MRRHLTLRRVLLAGVALAASVLALISYETGALNALERSSVDARFAIRGTHPPGSAIVIVALDTRTLRALGQRPPISRTYYARLLNRVRAGRPLLIGVDVQFTGRTNPHADDALLAAIARDGPVLLATHDTRQGPVPVPAGRVRPPGAVIASAAGDYDPDGVIRHMLYAQFATKTFAVRAAELLTGQPVSSAEFPDNHAWIDFRGPPRTFPTYSMADVLSGRVPSRAFAGRIVLVGVTDPQVKDIYPTAISSVPMAGVEIQANSLLTVLGGLPLQSLSSWIEILLLFLLAALPAALSLRLSALYVLAASIGILLISLVAMQLAFNWGVIVSVPDLILALVLGTAGAIAVDAFVTRRQLQKLQVVLPTDFFISYRHSVSETVANLLRDALSRKFKVWMDTRAIDAGDQWPHEIEEAAATCHAMLVVIGPGWLDAKGADGKRRLDEPGDWVRREISVGLARPELIVVPILHDGARFPAPDQLPDPMKRLADCQGVHLSGRNLDRWIDELVDSIEKSGLKRQLPGRGGTPQPPVPAAP